MTTAFFAAGFLVASLIDGAADLFNRIPQRRNENARRRKKHG